MGVALRGYKKEQAIVLLKKNQVAVNPIFRLVFLRRETTSIDFFDQPPFAFSGKQKPKLTATALKAEIDMLVHNRIENFYFQTKRGDQRSSSTF